MSAEAANISWNSRSKTTMILKRISHEKYTVCLALTLFCLGIPPKPCFAEQQAEVTITGKKLYESGKLEEAITALKENLKSNPNNAVAHYYLSLAYYRTKQKKLAFKHAKAVVDEEPNSAMGKYCAYLMGHMLTGEKKVTKDDGFVGIRFKTDVVTEVFKGSPAETAGVKVGDKILTVDNRPISGMSPRAIAKLIIGPKGSIVTVKVARSNKELSIKIKRGEIFSEAKRLWFIK